MASSSSEDQPRSLNTIIRESQGAKLFLGPEKWTPELLQHLGISFEKPSETHEHSLGDDNKILETVASAELVTRDLAFEDLMSKACDGLLIDDNVDFYFKDQSEASFNCAALREVGGEYPVSAHIDHKYIEQLKRAQFKGKLKSMSTKKAVEISKSKSEKKLSQVMPEDPLYEPLIAAMLIGLAQAQQRASLSRPDSKDSVHVKQEKLKTLANDDKEYSVQVASNFFEKSCFYVYSAVIPSACLARFNDPDFTPTKSPNVSIKIADVPFASYRSLHRRLFNDLCPDMEGTRDSDQPSSESPSSGDSSYVTSSS